MPAALLAGHAPLAARLQGRNPAAISVGLRPYDLEARDSGPGGALEARVVLLEPAGGFTWVLAELGGAQIKARLAGTARLTPGGTTQLTFEPEAAHLFDVATGRRLEAGAPAIGFDAAGLDRLPPIGH